MARLPTAIQRKYVFKKFKNFVFSNVYLTIMLCITNAHGAQMLPKDFVYLKDVAPFIQQDIRYYTDNNFIGRPLPGYDSPICILTKPTTDALLHIQKELNKDGLGLKVFDGYRPQITVDEFIRWSKDNSDQKMKIQYYPNINKADFFKLGYVAAKSGHTRGSTVDLTIVDLNTNQELDMGTHFDFMDELSHPFNHLVTIKQYQNRQRLNQIMTKHGFIPLNTEWWHFTLKNEPFIDTYFNFPVK
jgi:D-alanyl-D-alanine dipeptidase